MSKHGTFFWNELATSDVRGAKGFYGKLLGWTSEEMPMADGSAYTVVKAAGGAPQGTGGMMQMPKGAGMPDCWLAYVAVDDVDAVLAKAEKLGGAVALPAFDVENVGRIAHITDPSGARLGLITPMPMDEPAKARKSSGARSTKPKAAKPASRARTAPKGKPKAGAAGRARRA